MKIAVAYFAFLVMVVSDELRSFVARGHSDDLSRALGVLQNRQRWLDAGLPMDLDTFRHQYGKVMHFPPKMRKKSLSDSSSIFDSFASIPPGDVWRNHVSREPLTDDEDDDFEKRMKAKRSMFRERERKLDEEDQKRRKKKKRMMVVKKNNRRSFGDWGNSESELRTLAQRRFLDAILRGDESIQGPVRFDTSSEVFGNLGDDEVAALIDALRNNLVDSLDQQHYMEGEGPGREERKRTLPLRKRPMWQDGFRYALGDNPDKRMDENWDDSEDTPGPQERWWSHVDPKLFTALSEIEAAEERESGNEENDSDEVEDDDEMSGEMSGALEERKREQDPWFPAFDVKKRNRHSLWSAFNGYHGDRFLPLKRKRNSVFRERSTHDPGMVAFVGTSKRTAPIKRSPEEPIDIRKRMVKKSSETQPHVLRELKTILADDKDEKRVITKRENGNQLDDSVEEALDMIDTSSAVPVGDEQDDSEEDEFSEEDISNLLYNDIRKRSISRKRKRSWGDYFGMDKRQGRSVGNHQTQNNKIKKEGDEVNATASKTTEIAVKTSSDNATLAPLLPTPLPQEGGNNINSWMMNKYFKSMAAAMSSKKKRTVSADNKNGEDHLSSNDDDGEDSGNGRNPLATMAHKLEAIENLMLEEALELVEGHGIADDVEREEKREKILHLLDAAHSLVKMREALVELEDSLDRIQTDERMPTEMESTMQKSEAESDDEKKKKKKKDVTKKQNLVEALHVMAPQTNKRISQNSDEDSTEGKGECPIFNEIALLCSGLSESAGDLQRLLVGACTRHIMCYTCEYSSKDGSTVPCDLIFMRQAREICDDDLYCRSAAEQIYGALRQSAPAIEHSSAPVCLSEPCIRAYRRALDTL